MADDCACHSNVTRQLVRVVSAGSCTRACTARTAARDWPAVHANADLDVAAVRELDVCGGGVQIQREAQRGATVIGAHRQHAAHSHICVCAFERISGSTQTADAGNAARVAWETCMSRLRVCEHASGQSEGGCLVCVPCD